jgi:hypothetical protein
MGTKRTSRSRTPRAQAPRAARRSARDKAAKAGATDASKPAQGKRGAQESVGRFGTQAKPYIRADGQATRSTSIHLPVELYRRLRIAAATRGVHMSAIIAEALGDWFETHE